MRASKRHVVVALFIIVTLFTPLKSFADGEEMGGFLDSGFIPGRTDTCYGPYCMLCVYTFSASLGQQPPICGSATIPAYCGCNISLAGSSPVDAQCENW